MNTGIRFTSFLLLLLGTLIAVRGDLRCLDDNGTSVDWWVAYKLPKTSGSPFPASSSNAALNVGEAYALATSRRPELHIASLRASDPSSAFGLSLAPLYQKAPPSAFGYVVYNDQSSDGSACSQRRAHAKGVYMWDAASATSVWLVHSVPRFPPSPLDSGAKFGYPTNGRTNGQTLACATLSAQLNDEVFAQLQVMKPCVFASRHTAAQLSAYPSLNALLGAAFPPASTPKRTLQLSRDLLHVAKSGALGADLYSSVLRHELAAPLLVASWTNGASEDVASTCEVPQVLNVQEISVAGVSFSTKRDHSKWAVTAGPASASKAAPKRPTEDGQNQRRWRQRGPRATSAAGGERTVCVCDINREVSQFKRGGGCLCVRNLALATQFAEAAVQLESCR